MKRGNTNRRAPCARSTANPQGRPAITGVSIAIVCALLAGAGTACLWAVENGVVTSAPVDPARIGARTTSSPPVRAAIDGDHDGHNHDHDHDGHGHDHGDHDHGDRDHGDRDHGDHDDAAPARGSEPPTAAAGQPASPRRQRVLLQDVLPSRRRSPSPAATVATNSTDVDVEFWVEWGGGQPRPWLGTLRLDRGRIKTARGYGLQADAPGSIFLENNVVTVSPGVPRSFDGVLVRAIAPRGANLALKFLAHGSDSPALETSIPLLAIITSTQHLALDDHDNKLIVRRPQSDSLRLRSDRESMVFAPGETFEFSVVPNLVDSVEPRHRCRVQLKLARTESNLWADRLEAVQNPDGSISPAGPFKVTMPLEEGVYDLVISLDPTLLRGSRAARAPAGPWRKIQVAVVRSEQDNRTFAGGGQPAETGERFRVIQQFDPAHPEQPVADSQGFPFFESAEARRPTSQGDVIPVRRLERNLLQIGPQSWFSLPLQVSQPGLPHILEIDYPNDTRQTLGIAIYEPGSRRAVVDTALTTTAENLAERPGVATYRLSFWPTTREPILVLTARDGERAAAVGAIRISAGPDRLGELADGLPAPGRLLAAHLDTPRFPELFSATTKVDPQSGRELSDWVTFFDGARRLIQVLKQRGYNGAVIPVLADGGSLYPSRLLEPTPCFDDGIFSDTTPDPRQKDVLEMLLRMFDHEGLRLIPAVRFTGTLPILEAKRRLGAASSIDLVNTEGRRWRPQPDSFGGGSHYNPLDPEVQAALRAVVAELSQRCAAHASFAGVAVQLDPDSYANLPGPDWGADDATLKRFMSVLTQTPANPSGDQQSGDQQSGDQQSGDHQFSEQQLHQKWLAWRADRLAEMYVEMSRNLRDHAPAARLFLLGSSLLDTPVVNEAAKVTRAPRGMTAASVLLRFGIDVEKLRQPGIVFPAPRQVKPVPPDHIDFARAWDREFDRTFGPHGDIAAASLLEYPLQKFDTPPFAERLPVGQVDQETRTRVTQTGALGLRGLAHGLAAIDSQIVLDGAWQTPRDERAWRDSVAVYRRLPEVTFTTVSSPVGSRTQPVVIRRAVQGGRTLFYVVNDSAGPVDTKLGFDQQTGLELESLSATALPPLEMTAQGATLPLALRPYEIVGMRASLPDLNIVRWETEVEPRVLAALEENLQRLSQCVPAKREYHQLANADFDQPASQETVPGWLFGKGAGMQVRIDTHVPRSGPQALHLRSETPVNWSSGPIVWLRSEWFEPAESGRLVFGGWLKTLDFNNQPHVRMMVEGRLPDNELVRRERVLGAARDDPSATPLGADWNYYAVFVDNLPADVKDVRVGIDLRGTGDVWVDHVGVYDLWLSDAEKAGLNRDLGIAARMLEDGRVSDSEQLLKSHYAQYLLANVPVSVAAAPSAPLTAASGDVTEIAAGERPRPSPAFQVPAGPDEDAGPAPRALQVAKSPPPLRSLNEESEESPAFLTGDQNRTPAAEWTPTGDPARPTDRPITESGAHRHAPTGRAPAEPSSAPPSWLDKLKNFKLKLPDLRKPATR